MVSGARREKVAAEIGLSARTFRRWIDESGEVQYDRRPEAIRPKPATALSPEERQAIIQVCNEAPYASLPPSQIVPALADQGIYLASESSFYRVLKSEGQCGHRGRTKTPEKRALQTHTACGPNQVWCWDISYLPSHVRGRFCYLYAVIDIYSRKLVGWEVYDAEQADYACELLERTVLREGCWSEPVVLHSDNGSVMKASTFRVKLEALGLKTSYSRPRVSNDNAYSESLFRTLKYCPQWPTSGFETLDSAREWVQEFAEFYNEEHKHSQIRFVTPGQRHRGDDKKILLQRHGVYQKAMKENPGRWPGKKT
ncbi:IS3 family transposase, partial [Oceanospirillum sp. D5]|nr:IS3 family transposase [Oceanospirillum sediminis]